MDTASGIRLVLLAALWGGAFLCLRIGAPVFGPAYLTTWRVTLAAGFLLGAALLLRRPLPRMASWRHFLVLGALNSALPFLLFAYAGQRLNASFMSILNALAPIYAACLGMLWRGAPPTASAMAGLVLGLVGVVILAWDNLAVAGPVAWLALAAALLAPLFYAFASLYAQHGGGATSAFDNAHGSMWAAALLMLPVALLEPPTGRVADTTAWLAVLALGILCTGLAFLLYFRLMVDIGPMRTLTVTFLIPVFGVLWGAVLLGEPVGWTLVLGGICVLAGIALANGRVLWRRSAAAGAAP
ncbi:MAG: DMT family transporter [Candidatus Macondimonas sp.]